MEEAPVAVPGVRSGLGHDGDLPAGGFTELRLVVGGKNFYFFDGVRIDGYVSAAVVAGVYVGSAVQGELVLIGPCAIDIHGVQPARSGSVPVETAGHSRDQLHVIQNVPDYMKRSEEHTSELQSRVDLVCRLLLEKKK